MTPIITELFAGLTAARGHLEAGLARASDNHEHILKQKRPLFSKSGPEREREQERYGANQIATRVSADIVIRYKTALSGVTAEIERLTASLNEQHHFDAEPQTSDADFVEDDPPEPLYVRRAWQAYLNCYREDRAQTKAAGGGTVTPSAETTRAMYTYFDAVDVAEHGG
jgi:hypothetical protein